MPNNLHVPATNSTRAWDDYATDGKCHAIPDGASAAEFDAGYVNECGSPAKWIGETERGFRYGFCDRCRHTDESRKIVKWVRVGDTNPAGGANRN